MRRQAIAKTLNLASLNAVRSINARGLFGVGRCLRTAIERRRPASTMNAMILTVQPKPTELTSGLKMTVTSTIPEPRSAVYDQWQHFVTHQSRLQLQRYRQQVD